MRFRPSQIFEDTINSEHFNELIRRDLIVGSAKHNSSSSQSNAKNFFIAKFNNSENIDRNVLKSA